MITIIEVQRVPLRQPILPDVLHPTWSTNIGDGLRPVDIHFIQMAHAFRGIAIQSQSRVVSTQLVYCGASGTRDRLHEKIDRKVRQQQEKLKYKILHTNN